MLLKARRVGIFKRKDKNLQVQEDPSSQSIVVHRQDAKNQDFCPKSKKYFLQAKKKLIWINTEMRKERKNINGFLCPQSGPSLLSNGRNIKSLGINEDLYNAILHPHAKYGELDNSIPQLNYSMQMPEPLTF